MATKREIMDMLHAYALGCLDIEDLKSFTDEMNSGEEFPIKELAEYQNLAVLLPSILEIENPPHQMKDKVARKLYRIKDEIRAKRNVQRKNITSVQDEPPTAIPEPPPPPPSPPVEERLSDEPVVEIQRDFTEDTVINQNENTIEFKEPVIEDIVSDQKKFEEEVKQYYETGREEEKRDATGFEVVKPVRKTDEFFKQNLKPEEPEEPPVEDEKPPVPVEQEVKLPEPPVKEKEKPAPAKVKKETASADKKTLTNYSERYKPYQSKLPPERKSSGILLPVILFLIVAAVAAAFYFLLSDEVKTYKTEVSRLDAELRALSSQLSSKEEIQSILESQNVRIINMSGTELNPYGQGKILISFGTMKGYLQLSQMPHLAEGKYYHLWLNVNGSYTSLGLFRPAKPMEYFPFDLPQLISEEDSEFLLTEEGKDGVLRPSRNIYLTGYFH